MNRPSNTSSSDNSQNTSFTPTAKTRNSRAFCRPPYSRPSWDSGTSCSASTNWPSSRIYGAASSKTSSNSSRTPIEPASSCISHPIQRLPRPPRAPANKRSRNIHPRRQYRPQHSQILITLGLFQTQQSRAQQLQTVGSDQFQQIRRHLRAGQIQYLFLHADIKTNSSDLLIYYSILAVPKLFKLLFRRR